MAAYPVQLVFANNAQTTLAGSITNVAVTANLATGSGSLFASPSAGQGFVGTFTDAATGLLHEIVLVTSRTGDTITMTRAQEGTTAQSWAANDLFANLHTKGAMETMVQSYQLQQQGTNFAVDTGIANAYVAGFTPAISIAPPEGTPYRVRISNANTGASTLNGGWGVSAIRRRDNSALIGNELIADQEASFVWTGSVHQLQGVAPATAAAITAGTDTQSGVTPAQLAGASATFSGSLIWAATLATPAGYLLCDGSTASRTGQATLFNAITASSVVTITIATPGVITWNSHGLLAGDVVSLETTGTLPTGFVTGTNYYVVSPTTNTFELAASPGGSAINTSGSQSGVQTARHNPYGCGNGTTTFNLPDGRGRVLAMADLGAGRLGPSGLGAGITAVLGLNGGTQSNTAVTTVSVSGDVTGTIPVTGSMLVVAAASGSVNAGSGVSVAEINDAVTGNITVGAGVLTYSASDTATSGAFSTTQPTIIANLYIKT